MQSNILPVCSAYNQAQVCLTNEYFNKTEAQMKRLLNITIVSLGLMALASFATAGDVNKGESLSVQCVACHSNDGNSASPMFPKIAGLGEKYLLKQLKDIQSKQRIVPEMTGLLDNKSDADLADLAAFFDSKTLQLSGAKELKVKTNASIEVDSLVLGARIYRAGNAEAGVPACSGCHSPTGNGNAPAAFPRLGGQYAAYIEKQLKAFRAGERANDGDAMIMRSIAQRMTDAEIASVANFISGLH